MLSGECISWGLTSAPTVGTLNSAPLGDLAFLLAFGLELCRFRNNSSEIGELVILMSKQVHVGLIGSQFIAHLHAEAFKMVPHFCAA